MRPIKDWFEEGLRLGGVPEFVVILMTAHADARVPSGALGVRQLIPDDLGERIKKESAACVLSGPSLELKKLVDEAKAFWRTQRERN